MSQNNEQAGRMRALRRRIICVAACLALPAICANADALHARVRILVSPFAAAEADRPAGDAAAAAFSAVLTGTELAEVVRPSDPPLTWDRWAMECWQRDVSRLMAGGVDQHPLGLSPAGLRTIRSGGFDTEYAIEGKALRPQEGAPLTLHVALIDGDSGRQIAVAEAPAEGEEALAAAAGEIAHKLEPHWVNDVLARRVALLLTQPDFVDRDEIIPTLREWMKRWPDSPAPVLALFRLAAPPDRPMAAKETLELAGALREMVAAGDAGALELLRQTGTDPYAALADAAVMKGKQSEALALHREAARLLPAKAYGHLIDAAQAGIMSRKYPEALAAAREALTLDPENGYANLLCGILLDRCGKREEALAHLQGFLDAHPDDPAAGQIQAQIELMQ